MPQSKPTSGSSTSPKNSTRDRPNGWQGHGRFEWTLQFPACMKEDGFEDAEIHHYQDSLGMAKAHSGMFLVMLEELAMGIAKSRRQEEGDEDVAAYSAQIIRFSFVKLALMPWGLASPSDTIAMF